MRLPNLNRLQRAVLIAAAVVITLMQISYFTENDFEGYGWVFTVLVITALVLIAVQPRAKPAGFQISTAEAPPFEPPEDSAARVVANTAAIERTAENIGAAVTAGMPDLQTNRGNFPEVMGSMLSTSLLMYGLGLLIICKLRHDGGFLQSREYTNTRARVADAVTEAYNELQLLEPSEQQRVEESYAADFREVERHAVAFFHALASNNTRTPAEKLNAWLEERSSVQVALSKPLEAVAKEELRKMYIQLYGRAPTAPVP